jgi:hypothetical protein
MRYAPYREIGALLQSDYADRERVILFKTGVAASLRFYSGKKLAYVPHTPEFVEAVQTPGQLVLLEKRAYERLPQTVRRRLDVRGVWPLYHVAKPGGDFLWQRTRASRVRQILLAETVAGGE